MMRSRGYWFWLTLSLAGFLGGASLSSAAPDAGGAEEAGPAASARRDFSGEWERVRRSFQALADEIYAAAPSLWGEINRGEINPVFDFSETSHQYILRMDLPGMEKDKINIEATEEFLLIYGERRVVEETVREGERERSLRQARSYGSFSRRIPLPENADIENIEARYEQGVLEVRIMKEMPTEPETVTVPVE